MKLVIQVENRETVGDKVVPINLYFYRNSISSNCTGENNDLCSVTGNNVWWTLSPSHFHSYIICLHGSEDFGIMNNIRLDSLFTLKFVITLKPNVLASGSGTAEDPFVPTAN